MKTGKGMQCPTCAGRGKRLNPILEPVMTGYGLRADIDGIPLLVRCTDCNGTGRHQPGEERPAKEVVSLSVD